ncbi:MAG: hypothetical protein AB7Q29_05540 [Vicinamibacterales bacterium]
MNEVTRHPHPADARLLFVLSGDYGELSSALHLLHDQPLAKNALMLAPPHIASANAGALPCRLHPYRTPRDVVSALEEWQPDIAMLFSGYLYGMSTMFEASVTTAGVAELLQEVIRRAPRVVTSDPFHGLLFDPEMASRLCERAESLRVARDLLSGVAHFYPVRCDGLAAGAKDRAVWAFNPALVRSTPAADPFWLFVLSSTDYLLRVAELGEAPFVDRVCQRLLDAAAAGRHPVFIAPESCGAGVRARLGERDDVTILSSCPHGRFTELLLDAEYVFYWNMLSHSTVLRYGNSRPVFFFDQGHMCVFRPAYDTAVENYFLGWRPVFLDDRQPLRPSLLRIVDRFSSAERGAIGEHLRSGPTPVEMVAALLAS